MAKDIEEFLKMAAARRREAQPTQSAPAPTQPPRPAPQKVPPKQKKPPTRPSLVSESEIEVVTPRESVAKHVEKRIDTRRIQKQVEKLGEKVGQADDILEARLHQTFDHQVGRLAQPGSATAGSEVKPQALPRTARTLAAMIASPQNVQQAIIMSEILKRPEWD